MSDPNVQVPKVFTVTSKNYKELTDVYLETLAPERNGFNLVLLEMEMSHFKKFGFRTDSWYFAMEKKIEFLVEELDKCQQGERIVVSDADIQYFHPARIHDLIRQAQEKDLDWYGMAEGKPNARQPRRPLKNVMKYNGGFYILRVSPNMSRFFKDIADKMKAERQPYGDQSLINKMIDDSSYGLRHETIPQNMYVWGDSLPSKDSIFHHAVCTNTNADKLNQMKKVKMLHDRVSRK